MPLKIEQFPPAQPQKKKKMVRHLSWAVPGSGLSVPKMLRPTSRNIVTILSAQPAQSRTGCMCKPATTNITKCMDCLRI